eukprot:scaffold2640_cov256-Chaetoceros_neogracile.AAC.8
MFFYSTTLFLSVLTIYASADTVERSALSSLQNIKEFSYRKGNIPCFATTNTARCKRVEYSHRGKYATRHGYHVSPLTTVSRSANLIADFNICRGGSRTSLLKKLKKKFTVQDAALIMPYLCTQFALTIPVIIIPLIAADPFAPGIPNIHSANTAAFVGTMVSLSTFGAGIGKILNGFVCQALGGRKSGTIYMSGLAVFSVLLSTTYSMHGMAIAGMEFCASMMWTAMSVLIAEKYESDAARFSAAIMSLSLASTTGTLLAKTLGGALLSKFHWRQVCLLSAAVAFLGSAMLHNTKDKVLEDDTKGTTRALSIPSVQKKRGARFASLKKSIINVVGSRMFFPIAFAKFTHFIVRSSDKVLGTFIIDATNLPKYLAGSLTSSVTLGFVIGLVSGVSVLKLESVQEKKNFMGKRYAGAVASSLALALCANKAFGTMLGQIGLASAITIASGALAASVGFQFYQLIPMFAPTFGEDKAIFISFCDAFGFFMLSPFWSSVSKIVGQYGQHGWTISWVVVAAFLAAGGLIMTHNLETVMRLDTTEE